MTEVSVITTKTVARYLGLDVSLSAPGFAVIDVKNRRPTLVTARHVKTSAKQSDGVRYSIIEAFTTVIVGEYGRMPDVPFTAVIREDYKRPASKRQGQTIYGAWASVDTALNRYGISVTDEINASSVKRLIGGHGKADKDEVAAGAKRILRLGDDYEFATDDESDACAIVLAWLIENNKISKE